MKLINYESRTNALKKLNYNETIILSIKENVLASREQANIYATAKQLNINIKTDTALLCIAEQVAKNVIIVTRQDENNENV